MNERDEQHDGIVPVHLLTGFLGSGKTTLLADLLAYLQAAGRKPAVIMNELGEVNLDGELVEQGVPMAEMLGGCICCTIRGDLGVEIKALIDEYRPDVILIESTGAANPLEIIDGVTEAAMYERIDLRSITTVVDGPELVEQARRGKGRTYKLMKEQIRCATRLIVNKTDKLAPEELVLVQQTARDWNAHAPLVSAVRCKIDLSVYDEPQRGDGFAAGSAHEHRESHGCSAARGLDESHRASDTHDYREPQAAGDLHGHDKTHAHSEAHSRESQSSRGSLAQHGAHAHSSHNHVMAFTHYFRGPVDSRAFEAFLERLPAEVFRAKGVVTFADTSGRFLFQYAYRESDFIKIAPQGKVNDVAVFIGDHFDEARLKEELARLEHAEPQAAAAKEQTTPRE